MWIGNTERIFILSNFTFDVINPFSLQAKLGEMRSQLLTPQRAEMMRMEVTDELERQFQERGAKIQQENDAVRSEFSKLRYL